jgi:IMP dehydrogenase
MIIKQNGILVFDENDVRNLNFKGCINFDNVTLVPRLVSTLESRSEADTSIIFCGVRLEVPVIATPMPDVCNGEMAKTLAKLGAMGIIHRFQSIEDEVREFKFARHPDIHLKPEYMKYHDIACAIGATGDYQERFKALYDAGCRIFCIDTANGANIQVEKSIKWIREWEVKNGFDTFFTSSITKEDEKSDKVYIIAGAVATREGYAFLANLGIEAVRVGIAGGNVCTTRTETGVHMPTLESIKECYEYKICKEKDGVKNMPQIVADGGIRGPSDLNKAIALGADVAFCGSIFAGTSESPGAVINIDGELLKLYRGAASFGVQVESTDHEPDYVEGRETRILYKRGGVRRAISQFKHGLQSCASYVGALNLKEFRENVTVERL